MSSVVQRVNFHPHGQVVTDAKVALYPTQEIEIGDGNFLRVVLSITGSIAGSTGLVRVGVYGILGAVTTTQPFSYVDLTAGGVATIINGDILFTVSGYDSVVLRFGYDNAGAADNVTIIGQASVVKMIG